MSTNLLSSIKLTVEICPNCKVEMRVSEVSPVLFANHLEKVTYCCKACHAEMKRTYERCSGLVDVEPNNQYRITFFKHLLSSDGHPFKCLQHAVEIRRAKNPERAFKAAVYRYERHNHVPDWKLYADTFELEAYSQAGATLLDRPAEFERAATHNRQNIGADARDLHKPLRGSANKGRQKLSRCSQARAPRTLSAITAPLTPSGFSPPTVESIEV